jgi:hypothetical protein
MELFFKSVKITAALVDNKVIEFGKRIQENTAIFSSIIQITVC